MKNKYIDRTPPELSGDQAKDQKAILEYMIYLQEQLNWILSLIYKEI